jgi:inner membrane protein
MPSPIGHALAGLAIGLAGEPSTNTEPASTRRRFSRFAILAGVVAALPDADLVYSPIHRGVSHSIGLTIFLMIIAAAVTGWVTGRVRWRWVLVVGAAHASHILMDWLGTDRYPPQGLEALWPFSHRFYISDWNIFPPTERRLLIPGAIAIDLRAVLAEIAIVGPVVAIAWVARRRRRSRGPTSARDRPLRPSA